VFEAAERRGPGAGAWDVEGGVATAVQQEAGERGPGAGAAAVAGAGGDAAGGLSPDTLGGGHRRRRGCRDERGEDGGAGDGQPHATAEVAFDNSHAGSPSCALLFAGIRTWRRRWMGFGGNHRQLGHLDVARQLIDGVTGE
jgi:hypothetical protein